MQSTRVVNLPYPYHPTFDAAVVALPILGMQVSRTRRQEGTVQARFQNEGAWSAVEVLAWPIYDDWCGVRVTSTTSFGSWFMYSKVMDSDREIVDAVLHAIDILLNAYSPEERASTPRPQRPPGPPKQVFPEDLPPWTPGSSNSPR